MMRRDWIAVMVLLVALASAAAAATATPPTVRAFIDRNHVSLGQTITLNIDSSGTIGAPDLSPLQKDFQVLGTSRSSSVRIVNGATTSTSQLGIALRPLHAGSLTIPPLDVGGATTPPLTVQVGAAPAGGSAKVGDPVFMEANVLSSSPYVNQQTVYTVRLFYQPGVDGSLGDPTVDGARLVQLDRDHRYSVMRDGYAYQVIERSWALIPRRTGDITIEGPAFQGQQMTSGNPNAWLNNPNALLNGRIPGLGAPIHASAPTIRIEARAAPANAGKPWLPARNVQLTMTGLPASGEVNGSAPLTVTLGISASGQPADALPEPALPPIAGARVYPDQPADTTDDRGQWLHGTRTRSFAIVPERDGALRIPEITLAWWNVEAGQPEQATLPARVLKVSGVAAMPIAAPPAAAAGTVSQPSSTAATAPAFRVAVPAGAPVFWRTIALASLVLWLFALAAAGWIAWRWSASRRRRAPVDAAVVLEPRAGGDGMDASGGGAPRAAAPMPPAPKADLRALQRTALDAARGGDAAACEHALIAWARAARPTITGVGTLRDGLSDAAQRDALDALQRVRWQGGDVGAACGAVAHAFAHGFAWRADANRDRIRESGLPPLYPS